MRKIKYILFFLLIANLNLRAQLDSSKYGTIKIIKIDSAIYYFDIGVRLYNKARYDSALICLSKSLAFNSMSAKAYNGRCACYIYKNNYDSAFKDCLISVGIDSLQFSAFYNLGLCYSSMQNYNDAISYFSIAIKNASKDDTELGTAFYERGKLYERTNDLKNAKKDMEEAAKFLNYNATSWLLLNKTNSKK